MSSFNLSKQMVIALSMLSVAPAFADPFTFSSGQPDGRIAVVSRPAAGNATGREAADDFVTTASSTSITSASFTGLFVGSPGAGTPMFGGIGVEIYNVYPADSNTARTPSVPTRVNSPSDVAFDSRDSAVAGQLSFATAVLSPTFAAANSVLNGINPTPQQTTGGEGAVIGTEIQFTVNFTTPFVLAANHYFFVPQVQVMNGEFYWLSTARPIDSTGTPFAPDLQSWVRSDALGPDWLRVGTDIVGGAGTFNQAFTLTGTTVAAVPEPQTWALLLGGLAAAMTARRHRRAGLTA